jgi:periplasmic protein TonB
MTAGAATGGGRRAVSVGYAASAILHLAFFAWLVRIPAAATVERETVAFDLVEVAAPEPPAPVAEPEPPKPEPAPVPHPQPSSPSVARPQGARSRGAPAPAELPDGPPPPNEAPPPDAPKKAPIRIGVSMSSTTSAGSVAAPVGNTLYGELPREAPKPEDVKPYRAERTVAPTQVSMLPKAVRTEIPRDEYPREARQDGVQGAVSLQLLVGVDGKVKEAKVVRDPLGFGPAAVRSALRHFLFQPARRGDEVVAAWVTFTVRYELE